MGIEGLADFHDKVEACLTFLQKSLDIIKNVAECEKKKNRRADFQSNELPYFGVILPQADNPSTGIFRNRISRSARKAGSTFPEPESKQRLR